MNKCLSCGKDVKNKYCNVSCQNRHQNTLKFSVARHSHTIKCDGCGKERTVLLTKYEYNSDRYSRHCNHSCAMTAVYNRRRKEMKHHFCLYCNTELPVIKNGCTRKFCNHVCHMNYRRKLAFEKIKDLGYIPEGIGLENTGKAYLISVRGHKCECCGLSEWLGKPISLNTHHKNGRSKDNHLTNLELLCPNCHTQTPNFGRKNKNCDRVQRRIYRNAGEVLTEARLSARQ